MSDEYALLTQSGDLAAWSTRATQALQTLSQRVGLDAAVVGYARRGRVTPESVLAHITPDDRLVQWARSDDAATPRLPKAVGVEAVGGDSLVVATLLGPSAAGGLVTLDAGESGPGRWYLLGGGCVGQWGGELGREAVASLALLRARFDWPEPHASHLLLNEHGQVLLADASLRLAYQASLEPLEAVADEAVKAVHQRWDGTEPGQTRSVVLTLADQPVWLQMHCLHGPIEGCGWQVELRQIEQADPPAVGVVEDDRVARSLGFITDRYRESPSLEQVADSVDVSQYHFHRLFSRTVGLSPKAYLLRLQLLHAKWLLRTTGVAVGKIASRCGFASHGHFTATFTRVVGMSPSDYRDAQG